MIHLDDEQISCSFLCGTDKPPQVARALDLPRLTDLLLYEGDSFILCFYAAKKIKIANKANLRQADALLRHRRLAT